ncbi:hypothetical protein N658DRAFT_428383 [Parathielavia hyrcaniae]|uniref:Uncharacterized protein n=1 Tax=Parathielavia hyrcaniae TaxID=113614 RepID=A0AAN6T0T5_9PEZI|nr:hypothetical protein N658DRAFT_428383 [Parathielavia hyrcaniae]
MTTVFPRLWPSTENDQTPTAAPQTPCNMTNTTCPGNAIPDITNLPVPQDINVFVTTGTNASYPPMEACCQLNAPNAIHAIDECWIWCEIPTTYFNGTDKDGARSKMSACLRLGNTARSGTGFQMNTAARPGIGSLKEIGLWALVLSGFVYIL